MTKRLLVLNNLNEIIAQSPHNRKDLKSVKEIFNAALSSIEYAMINIDHITDYMEQFVNKNAVATVNIGNSLLANIYIKYKENLSDLKKATNYGDIIHFYKTLYFNSYKNLDISMTGHLTILGSGGLYFDEKKNSVDMGGFGSSKMVYDGDITLFIKSFPIYLQFKQFTHHLNITSDFQSSIDYSGDVMIDSQCYSVKDLIKK